MDSRDEIWSTECLKNYGRRFVTWYRRWWPKPSPRKRNATRQHGCLRRPYQQLRKEEKRKAREKKKDIPIWTQSSNSKEREESLLFPDGSNSKISACNAGNLGLIPGSRRSPGEGGYPLQGRIPWTEEPSGLQFTGSQRVGHDWETNTFTFTFSEQCRETEKNNRVRKTRELFKGIRETMGTFQAKMGTIKDRNAMDLTEAEDTKQR